MSTIVSSSEGFRIESISPAEVGITTLHVWLSDLKEWKEKMDMQDKIFPSIEEMDIIFEDIAENGQLIPFELVAEIICLEEEFWKWRISLRPSDGELVRFGKEQVESYKRLVEAFADGKKYDELRKSVGVTTGNILQ